MRRQYGQDLKELKELQAQRQAEEQKAEQLRKQTENNKMRKAAVSNGEAEPVTHSNGFEFTNPAKSDLPLTA